MLRKFRSGKTRDDIRPFLEEAEAAYPETVAEVSATAGSCGPIARRMLAGSAMISATGFFFMSRAQQHADPESREAMSLARTGAQFLGTWKQAQTCSAVHFSWSINCASVAVMVIGWNVAPLSRIAVFPTLPADTYTVRIARSTPAGGDQDPLAAFRAKAVEAKGEPTDE